MKSIITVVTAFVLGLSLWAQSPEKMSYQAVIRNSSDQLVVNTQIGMQISVLQGSSTGTPVFVETQTPTSNSNGLVSLEIGDGTVVSGNFSSIDWANGPYFILTETDPAGGTSYSISGVSQLLSVPYALHSATADTVIGNIAEADPVYGASIASSITVTDTTNWNNKQEQMIAGKGIRISGDTISLNTDFYLGQDTLGGIVFYIYKGSDGSQHGLIVSKLQTVAKWQNVADTTDAGRSWDGSYNTNLMTDSPAKEWIILNFTSEWYLPSIDELIILFNNRFHVNKALSDIGIVLLSKNSKYWSSTELDPTTALAFDFQTNGILSSIGKLSNIRVRAIKAF